MGQPRKIFQGETGCKKGWKKAHSIPPRLFNRRGNSYRPVQQLPSRNSSQFTYTIDNYFSFPLKKKKKTIFISRKLHPKIKGNIFTKLKISLLQKKEKFETRSCKTIIFLTNENRLMDEWFVKFWYQKFLLDPRAKYKNWRMEPVPRRRRREKKLRRKKTNLPSCVVRGGWKVDSHTCATRVYRCRGWKNLPQRGWRMRSRWVDKREK